MSSSTWYVVTALSVCPSCIALTLRQHNYARWNGGIISQGGPTNEQYASLWSQVSALYADTPRALLYVHIRLPRTLPTSWTDLIFD